MKTRDELALVAQQLAGLAGIFNPALGASIQAFSIMAHRLHEMVDIAARSRQEAGESDEAFDARIAEQWEAVSAAYKDALAKFYESKPH